MKGKLGRFVLLVSLALNITVLVTVGYLQHRQSAYWLSPFGTKMARDRFIFEELSLSPEQMAAMKARARLFRAEIDQGRQVVTARRLGLVTLLRADQPEVAAINAEIGMINELQGEMQRKIAAHMLEEKARLAPEQQRKFLDLIEEAMRGGGQLTCPSM